MSDVRVALTFDAEHPSRAHCGPGIQERVVDILAAEAVPATFFVQGRWLTAYPQLGRRIHQHGHVVGNHSHAHARLTRLSREGLEADVREAEMRIRQLAGADPRPWFRCPYGDGADDPEVIATLAALGYRHVHWDIDSCDWCDGQTAAGLLDVVMSEVGQADRPWIVLMHTWPEPTAAALPMLISELRALGASFVTVAEMPLGAA